MATSRSIYISPENTGLWDIKQSDSVAKKITELLQKDIEAHHIFFNQKGFHNHISHHLLALYGTGASAQDIVKGYIENEGYQRPAPGEHEDVIHDLKDWEQAKKCLGQEQYYTDWLRFFQHELGRLGWREALQEYLFKGDERSEDMMVRMFAGVLHPLIQLMYGLEWEQPAIIAMAMAQACVHRDELRKFLLTAEEEAKSAPTPMPTILSLLDTIAGDDELRNAPRWEDDNKSRDGVLGRAWHKAVKYGSQVRVGPDELRKKTAEMFNAAVYLGACTALHPGKEPKFDFFLIHHINLSPIFVVINKQDWISTESKVRLLEWKIRLDMIEYVTRGCPKLSADRIPAYVPKDSKQNSLTELVPRIHNMVDDGHACKLFRSVVIAQKESGDYEDEEGMMIKGDSWKLILQLVIDALEAPGPRWVQNTGWEEAWKDVPSRSDSGERRAVEDRAG